MSEERMKYIEKCQKFVRQVDTLVAPSSDLELERYRKVGAILEEQAERRLATNGSEYLEEQQDVMFYCLSLLNYLETYGGVYPRRLQRPITPDYHITSFEQYLGILKKITRSGEQRITLPDYSLYCFTWEYVATRLDDRFIECMTEKLIKKFPQHCKEWGLTKDPVEVKVMDGKVVVSWEGDAKELSEEAKAKLYDALTEYYHQRIVQWGMGK